MRWAQLDAIAEIEESFLIKPEEVDVSDVVARIRVTARDGGDGVRGGVCATAWRHAGAWRSKTSSSKSLWTVS